MQDIILPSWCKPLHAIGKVEDRSLGIGSTDIAAIVGLSPFATAFDVWLDKKGQAPKREPTEAMSWGNRCEPVIASAYADETRAKIMKVGVTLAGHDRAWLIGSPDYLSCEKPLGMDCKNIRFKREEWGEPGSDKVPDYYLLQCAWFMALTGAPSWDVAALFGGSQFEIFTIGRNERLEASLIEKAEEFWSRFCIGNERPEIEDSPKVREWIKGKFPKPLRPMRKATAEESALALALRKAKDDAESAKESAEALAVKLKAFIGDDEGLELPDGKVTWKKDRDSTAEVIDWQAIARELGTENQLATLTLQHKKTIVTRQGARKLIVTIKGEEES